jgi:hypothetical protein
MITYNYTINEMIDNCKNIDDKVWGLYTLKRDFFFEHLANDKLDCIHSSILCGVEEARKLRKQFPSNSPTDIATALGLTIRSEPPFALKGFYLFAEFHEPDEIVLYQDVIDGAENMAKDSGISLFHLPFADHFIAHELFHYIEMNDDTLYTNKTTLSLKSLIPGKRKNVRLKSLGEIAGMAFAKELLNIDYSPLLLDIMLLYPRDIAAATAIYNEIITLNISVMEGQ